MCSLDKVNKIVKKSTIIITILFLTISYLVAAETGDSLALVFSADVQGQLEACHDCGSQTQLGRLAYLGTQVNRLRQENPAILLVDTGNAFFGADSLGNQGKVVVSAYNALGYGAVNLSFRDFRLGKAATLALLKEAQFPLLSANLRDADTGALLAKPYVVKEAGGERIAIIGVTQSPAGLDDLPHLKEQLAGIRIQAPVEALGKWLPKAKAEADRVVLLYYGSYAGLEPIREKFGGAFAAILVGGTRPEYLPEQSAPPIVGTSDRGQQVAEVRLTDGQAEVKQHPVDASLPASPEIEKILAEFRPKKAAPTATTTAQPAEGQVEGEHPATVQPGLAEIIIGQNLRADMPLVEAMALLGEPQAKHSAKTNGQAMEWLDYPALGIALGAKPGGTELDVIEVGPAFKGRLATGLRIGDPHTAVLDSYGIPESLTPDRARYPDQGLVFKLQNRKVVGAEISRAPPTALRYQGFTSGTTLPLRPADQAVELPKQPTPAPVPSAQPEQPSEIARNQAVELAVPNIQVQDHDKSPVLQLSELTTVSPALRPPAPVDETGVAVETEPNNDLASANPLEMGKRLKGAIDPLNEQDFFKITVPDTGRSVLTLDYSGQPHLRTSIDLLDATGTIRKHFDPSQSPMDHVFFSWLVQPGQYFAKIAESPASIVLIWDTSNSMEGSLRDLKEAVEAYLSQVRPSEQLNLIQFYGEVKVLLPAFTSDQERLIATVQDKFVAGGGTALYDAIAQGIELLDGLAGNRGIIVMTDGFDTDSKLKYPEFWQMLEQKRIRLYTIGLGADLQKFNEKIDSSGDKLLAHIAMATGGRYFFAHSSNQLKGYYEEIAKELRTSPTYYLRPTLARGPGNLSVVSTGKRIFKTYAPRTTQIELILDASGSMKEKHKKVDGRLKIDVAKEVMIDTIKGLPDDTQLALRFFGHRVREGSPGDCEDTELMYPIGLENKSSLVRQVQGVFYDQLDKPSLVQQVQGVKALGTTPLAYSIRQAANDFGTKPGEKLLVVVTDGKEECGGDPPAVAEALVKRGLNLKIQVVGFALADEITKQHLRRIAEITQGCFFDARDRAALRRSLEAALAVSFDVLDAAGEKVASGSLGGGPMPVPEGIYFVVLQIEGGQLTVPEVKIAAGLDTVVKLEKEGGTIGVKVIGPQGSGK